MNGSTRTSWLVMALALIIVVGLVGASFSSLPSWQTHIRRYHIEHNGWEEVGYHYVIERDAAVKKGRNNGEIGAHCRGDNDDSLGVCLIGKGEALPLGEGYLTLEMFAALLKLLRDLKGAYPTIGHIWGHREKPSGIAQGKTCPGFDVGLLRALVLGEG